MGTRRSSVRLVDHVVPQLGLGPWGRGELLGSGMSPGQLERLLARRLVVRLRRGVYALPDAESRAEQLAIPYDVRLGRMIAIARRLDPGIAFSHDSAAYVQQMWTPNLPSTLVQVTQPGASERLDGGVQVHSSRLPEHHVEVRSGLRVTTVARTAVDLCLCGDLPSGLVATDSALRVMLQRALPGASRRMRNGTVPQLLLDELRSELVAAADEVRGWPGSRTVDAAIAAADPRSESAFESWSRGWILAVGLPRPEVNRRVVGASGRIYYGDLVWEEYGVIGEADGLGKYGRSAAEVRQAMRGERDRQSDLEAAGWRFVRWASGDLGATIVARLGRALYLGEPRASRRAERGA